MRHAVAFGAAALTLVVVMPAAALESKPPANFFGQRTPAPKPPRVDWNWRPPIDEAQPVGPSVVCGMTVIPADSTIDPKIRVAPSKSGVTFTMRAIQPKVCRTP